MGLTIQALGVAVMAMLGAYSGPSDVDSSFLTRGIILPHHNLVAEYIDDFYEEVASNELETVIIMSTNHYDVGDGAIMFDPNLCDEVDCDFDLAENLAEFGVVSFEPSTMSNEHGVRVHLDRISANFGQAKVLPLTVRWQTSQEILDEFVDSVLSLVDIDETLVIASIDFSHFVTEETALANDKRTQTWLEDFGEGFFTNYSLADIWDLEKSIKMDTDVSTALDSPETFYIFTKLMQDSLGQDMSLEVLRRTSSLSLTGKPKGDPMQNTSHLFVRVSSE